MLAPVIVAAMSAAPVAPTTARLDNKFGFMFGRVKKMQFTVATNL